MKKALLGLLILIAICSIGANFLLMQRYSSSRPLMRIGSRTISIKEYRDQIDAEYGKQTLNKMAYTMLIREAASKAGVMPTENQIAARIAAMERRTPKALEEAYADPHKMELFREDLTTNMALENLSVNGVTASEAEARAFYEKNRSLFHVANQARTAVVVAETAVDAQTAKILLKQDLPLAAIAKQPRLYVVGQRGFKLDWEAMSLQTKAKLSEAVAKAPLHGIVTVPTEGGYFVTRIDARSSEETNSFAQAKEAVERLVRVQKAPSQQVVLARLFRDANVSFESSRYEAFFSDIRNFSETSASSGKSVSQASSTDPKTQQVAENLSTR